MAKTYNIKKMVLVEQEVQMDGTLEEIIAYNVTRLRKIKGWNQEDLSQKIDLSRASISNIEVGRHSITLKNLEKLCEVFGCSSSDILPF